MEEDRRNGWRASPRLLDTVLIAIVALGAVAVVFVPRLQTPRVGPSTSCSDPTCSPSCTDPTCSSSCADSTCFSRPIAYIGGFSILPNGTSLRVQFALLEGNGVSRAIDGSVKFSFVDAFTNGIVYQESFSVNSSQFVHYVTPWGNRVIGYVWFIPVSQIGKIINSSSGTADLTFTAIDARTFSDTLNPIALPSLTGPEAEQLYESKYLQSALTVQESQTKGDFNVTLVRVGNWTHPMYKSSGPLETKFRVDMTVTCVATQPENLWLYYIYLLDNLGGSRTWVGTNTLTLGQLNPGETRTGYLLFPALISNISGITLVVTEIKSPANIVYQFQVDI